MNQFENELRRALQRVEPPQGFAERVLARTQTDHSELAPSRWWAGFLGTRGLRWAAACALSVVLATSGFLYQRAMERRRGEAAKEQLMLALRITSSKLQVAEQGLRDLDSASQSRPR
jgi:hypothetical protein